MRLWSIHPRYLDTKRLVAQWKECLTAHKVLSGQSKGYNKHPAIIRFKDIGPNFIALYMDDIYTESIKRGFKFNKSLIPDVDNKVLMFPVTSGQIAYEKLHIERKTNKKIDDVPDLHSRFYQVEGNIEWFEKVIPNKV